MVKLPSKIDKRGRVTIPVEIREALGITGESDVLVDVTNRAVVEILVGAKLEDDPLWKALQKPLEIPPKLAKSFNVEKEREKIWAR